MKTKCVMCGKSENSPLHERYGNDINNPRKHRFEPVSEGKEVRACEDWGLRKLIDSKQDKKDSGYCPKCNEQKEDGICPHCNPLTHQEKYNSLRTEARSKFKRFLAVVTDAMITYQDNYEYLKGKEKKIVSGKIKDANALIRYLSNTLNSKMLKG